MNLENIQLISTNQPLYACSYYSEVLNQIHLKWKTITVFLKDKLKEVISQDALNTQGSQNTGYI